MSARWCILMVVHMELIKLAKLILIRRKTSSSCAYVSLQVQVTRWRRTVAGTDDAKRCSVYGWLLLTYMLLYCTAIVLVCLDSEKAERASSLHLTQALCLPTSHASARRSGYAGSYNIRITICI